MICEASSPEDYANPESAIRASELLAFDNARAKRIQAIAELKWQEAHAAILRGQLGIEKVPSISLYDGRGEPQGSCV